MDRIFSEIKKAIEEEMRNAESGPSPGGGSRPQGGGRRAQEYAEWLKDEQQRLRGDQPAQPIEEYTISADTWEQDSRQRQEASTRRHQERRQQRSGGRSQERPEPQRQQRQQPQQRSNAYSRSESRHQRRSASAYDQRTRGAAVRRRVQRLLSTNQGLRQAFLMREIVGKPLSLRDKDDHLITS